MLTKELAFGMNLVSLAGFAVMAVALALSRRQPVRVPLAVGLMAGGTALLLLGLYVAPSANR